MNVVDQPGPAYDLILVSHNTCLPKVSICEGPKVFTAHGTFPALEQPHTGADYYVSISEEVQQHLAEKGFESTVIRNGVDCTRFNMRTGITAVDGKPRRVLCLAQDAEARKMVKEACMMLGIAYAESNNQQRVEDQIWQADVVISLGRGCYEAMACGRGVLVFDNRWYMRPCQFPGDGFVTAENWEQLAKFNFSGRATKEIYTAKRLAQELEKFNTAMGAVNLRLANENYNVEYQVDKYLELIGEQKTESSGTGNEVRDS
jgi:glycosyltransferase involved in cell wall biosynthesis